MRRLWLVIALVAVAATTVAILATQAGGAPTQANLYTVKFACGEFGKGLPASVPNTPEGPVVPGYYQTAINVHNPNSGGMTLQKKAVLLYVGKRPIKEGNFEQQHRPGKIIGADLASDSGLFIDCQDIRAVLLPGAPAAPTFIEGFVVIIVPAAAGGVPLPLDVSALYTGHSYNCVPSSTGGCSSISREGFSEDLQVIQPTQGA